MNEVEWRHHDATQQSTLPTIGFPDKEQSISRLKLHRKISGMFVQSFTKNSPVISTETLLAFQDVACVQPYTCTYCNGDLRKNNNISRLVIFVVIG